MFDQYVFSENSCENVQQDGKTTGFKLRTRITYYRGIPLSMVHNVRVMVDGTEVPRDAIRFTIDEIDWFTLDELETVASYKWEYSDEATIMVVQEGGLSKGEHEVFLELMIRVAYIPVPMGGNNTRVVKIA